MLSTLQSLLRRTPIRTKDFSINVDDIVLSPSEAVKILLERASDAGLRARVQDYLRGDMPEYARSEPFIYSAHYVVSANFETLRFLSLTEPLEIKTILTQDTRDIFVPQNVVKKTLLKLPVYKRVTNKNGRLNELYEYVSIADVNAAQGKAFASISTLWGEPLVDFHRSVLNPYLRPSVYIHDDTEWIDRNGRSHLLELYKRFLALFVAHGVFFEDYTMKNDFEIQFTNTIVRPAFEYVTKTLGATPLIAQLAPQGGESDLFWNSYPHEILTTIEKRKHAGGT